MHTKSAISSPLKGVNTLARTISPIVRLVAHLDRVRAARPRPASATCAAVSPAAGVRKAGAVGTCAAAASVVMRAAVPSFDAHGPERGTAAETPAK